ncbi:Protein translocase subunit SecE [Candidatus Trichorickettsia mobilis]|uniref:Protein translocase subunit SecE n=1 Tax=Candidatus Trichorickettsia mobilis TaxID=1346319 RepID=A0ABZ0UTC2_9RICK|nr:preprotein translocase subunit SecE [Candidatus Trichorickettsia mobilis]WPY00445.1 Protein translocase subunit SecE [Candidatus Trichorickettsia mobilis]
MLKDNKIIKFYEQVKQEAYKVVWPNKKELITSTSIIVVAVLICSVICMILDYGIHGLVRILLNIGK